MKPFFHFLPAVLILTGTLAASKFSERPRPDRLVQPLESIPQEIRGWIGAAAPKPSAAVEAKLLTTEELTRIYRRGDRFLDLWVAYYSQQRAGESMHSPKVCLPGAGWEPVEYGFVQVPLSGHPPVKVNRYVVEKDAQKLQVLYWYQSKERIIASEYTGKVFLVWDSILGRTRGGALVRITTPDRQSAVEDEIGLASVIIPAMERCLRLGVAN